MCVRQRHLQFFPQTSERRLPSPPSRLSQQKILSPHISHAHNPTRDPPLPDHGRMDCIPAGVRCVNGKGASKRPLKHMLSCLPFRRPCSPPCLRSPMELMCQAASPSIGACYPPREWAPIEWDVRAVFRFLAASPRRAKTPTLTPGLFSLTPSHPAPLSPSGLVALVIPAHTREAFFQVSKGGGGRE